MSKAKKFQRILAAGTRKLLGETPRSRAETSAAVAVLATAAITIFLSALALPSKIMANDGDENDVGTFTVDVAFRNPYFQNSVDPTETVRNPIAFSPGDTFIQDGVIFPGGTIPEGPTGFDPDTHPGAIGT